MKRDFRCWVTGAESCDWNCDSNPQPWGECGKECDECECTSCNQSKWSGRNG